MLNQSNKLPDNTRKDPEDWKTGEERATGAQISYIETMSQEAGVETDVKGMTKAQAAEKIEELQKITGRGQTN
ncbi:MAG TPA: DUF3072 domain-containing protein [Patescibacteria group bacterium]|nr:DUF3072 domain-containing protein [Patescibacteria group bacterium]